MVRHRDRVRGQHRFGRTTATRASTGSKKMTAATRPLNGKATTVLNCSRTTVYGLFAYPFIRLRQSLSCFSAFSSASGSGGT